jgi:hypothetical protein
MFPVEHLLGTNTFTAMEEPISLTLLQFLNIKTHLMKSTFIASFDGIYRYFLCANDATRYLRVVRSQILPQIKW